jgi:hypothetical protein
MSLATAWLCVIIGIVLFVLTAWLDDREVELFVDPAGRSSSETEKLLWVRIVTRQLAAFMLVMMLDVLFNRIAQEESAVFPQAGRFFLAMAESANLLRLHYYHDRVRQAERRAVILQAWRSGSEK